MIPPIVAAVAPPAQGNTTGLGSAKLDRYIDQQMFQMRTPGLAVLAVRDGEVLWSKGYGYADIQRQVPVTPETVFHLASISKSVVATAVMQLWEHGKLDLDDDVDRHLPFSVRNPQFPDAPVTFRMLLQHSGGFTSNGNPPFSTLTMGMDSPAPLGDFLADYFVPGGQFYSVERNFNSSLPGTKYEYSNVGYNLLAYLVERISDTPFDEYTTQNIFAPLGMERTTWRLADLFAADIEPAIPYIHDQTSQSYFPFGHNASADYASGGLRSSADDLASFLLAHMNGGTHDGATILRPQTVALMHMKHSQIPPNDEDWRGWTGGYGFGFEVTERGPGQQELIVGHSGLWFGVATSIYFRPEDGVGVIVLANAAPGILTPNGPASIPGREFSSYSFIAQRLLDEAAAFGATRFAGRTAAVPEPSTITLLALCLALIGCRRRVAASVLSRRLLSTRRVAMFRSKTLSRKSACLPILLVASACGLAIGAADRALAAKPQPSPFAGCYAGGDPNSVSPENAGFVLSISDSGRISGATSSGKTISGRIWNDGYLELDWPYVSFHVGKGGRRIRSITLTGIADLDDDGNLYGVLADPDDQTWEFFWPHCD